MKKKNYLIIAKSVMSIIIVFFMITGILSGCKKDEPISKDTKISQNPSDKQDENMYSTNYSGYGGSEIQTGDTGDNYQETSNRRDPSKNNNKPDSKTTAVESSKNDVKKTENKTSSNKPTSKPDNSKTFSILGDPTFENGFNVLGMNISDSGSSGRFTYNPLESNGRQYWNLAQWGTKYSFEDSKYTTKKKLSNNVYKLENHNKGFTINYNENKLIFQGITSKLYETPRTGGDWFHLLIEQSFRTADTKVTDLAKVQVTMSNRLTYFKDNMGDKFNPSLHAAQFLMYFMVTNRDQSSKDFSKYIWFGFPFFDNRMEWNPPSSMLDKGTGSLMVGIGNEILYKDSNNNNCWKNGKINASPNAQWSKFSIDVLPLIKDALNTAHKDNYLTNTKLDQLYLTGMNLGWEIPGSYDATMEVKDFSVMGTRK